MIEFFVTFFIAITAIEVAADAGSKAYEYAEPKVVQLLSDEVTEEVQE